MSERVEPGNLAQLVGGIFRRVAARHPNPAVKAVPAIFSEEIDRCLNENLGPGTKADEVGRKILRVFDGGQK
jgi:hypothetical protein